MEAMENVRSAHVFDLKWLKEFYLVFGIYYKIHSIVFTWRHGGHISVPKQWNGGHVCVPN